MGKRLASVGIIIGGGVLIWTSWSGGVYLNDWSNAELVGYNISTLLFTGAGLFLIYWGGKKLLG